MKRIDRSLILRLWACLSVALALWSCDKFKDFEIPETGCYYNVLADGEHYLFYIDEITKQTGRGHYYTTVDGAISDRHQFEATVMRKAISFKSDGGTRKLSKGDVSWEKYVEPEFHVRDYADLYKEPKYDVRITKNITYASGEGYWSSLEGVEADATKALTEGYLNSFKKRHLKLEMDVYRPVGLPGRKPFILFIHGGAFYVGSKDEPAYFDFCQHFASMGYVTASINYRLGFHVGKGAIERAAYAAAQDAHAAMRFIVHYAENYEVDPDCLYIAGSSAGSITALNVAFMEDEDRPKSSHGRGGIFRIDDMGPIDSAGNELVDKFHVRALANMWGAVSSLDILENSNTAIISFHGDQDKVVPYNVGYPFESAGRAIASTLSDQMYGSVAIDDKARQLGLKTEMHSFAGEGHALNTTGPEKQPNQNHEFIKENITRFFYETMVPEEAAIKYVGDGVYSISDFVVGKVDWKVDGGFIVSRKDNQITVLWKADAPEHIVYASGEYAAGMGFNLHKEY